MEATRAHELMEQMRDVGLPI